jgi:molecular chaperone DnaK (HSP70)
MSDFIIGIDLGTTHTVVAYAPRLKAGRRKKTEPAASIQLFDIDQLVASGEVAALPLLPSVRYHPAPGELAAADLQLPWPPADAPDMVPAVMGRWARHLGSQVPGRLVASAKSWLSHTGVDRLAPILPWGAADDVPKISPVAASASYLRHVHTAWNARFPKSPLAQQDLVLTVPASFDEAARALTLQAAREAGLPQLRLLEEPQAAFYDWLLRHRADLGPALGSTQLVLVADVGGGTTDFSLIQVALQDGEPRLTRIGVGKHLMLGGDNMDLALAHWVESRLNTGAADSGGSGNTRLSATQLAQLMERCRVAKEQLLATDAPSEVRVTLLGSGSRLIGASRSVTLTRDEVRQWVVDGFFPQVAPTDQAQQSRGGIVAFGLPYARDAAITRHLADFLRQHAPAVRQALGLSDADDEDTLALPDALLLNGGVFRAEAIAQRLQHTLADWRGAPLRLLHNDNPDVAVARGAVAYALAQQGLAPKIGGGAARSYHLLLEEASKAGKQRTPRGICILPRGTEPGQEVLLKDRQFALRLGQPVRFHLYSALAQPRQATPHVAGELVDLDPQHFDRLPPIATVLHSEAEPGGGRHNLPVQLVTTLTEMGTLELHCVSLSDPNQRWKLEFDLRHQPQGEEMQGDAPSTVTAMRQAVLQIDRIFGTNTQAVPVKEVRQLRQYLEKLLGDRERWDTSALRPLFDALLTRARGRRRSPEHERVWLNLIGYCLRPGFGDPLDEWRVQQLWALFPAGVQHPQDKQVCAEWWTLWRRVAGGLGATEQLRLLDDFAFNLHINEHGDDDASATPVPGSDEDMLRLGASLERIPVAYKSEIGTWLIGRLHSGPSGTAPPSAAELTVDARTLWALGRIGARQPFHGHLHDVVPVDTVTQWIETLLALDWKALEPAAFAATQLARVTDDRSRDLPQELREHIIQRLQAVAAPDVWVMMVREHIALDEATERRILGDALPPGLKLI